MAFTFVNDGERVALELLLNKTGSLANTVMGLYTNNQSISNAVVLGDLTEATGSGYSAITLTGSSWTITEGAPTSAAFPQQTFTFSGAIGPIYGYFIKHGSTLIGLEAFSAGPYTYTSAGGTLKVTVNLTAGSSTND